MSLRIIRITTHYAASLRQFYARNAALAGQPYAAQYAEVLKQRYGWADVWTRAFAPLGHEVWEPVGNAEEMQKAWAREHGVAFSTEGWLFEIATAQVVHFKPDVLFVNDPRTYTADFLKSLRAACPSIRLVLGWCGAPYRDAAPFREYDVVLSNIPSLVEHFRAAGHRCEQMHHAFDPQVLECLGPAPQPSIDFSFIGSLVKGQDYHNHREELLTKLVRKAGLRLWVDVKGPEPGEVLATMLRQRAYDLARAGGRIPGGRALLSRVPKLCRYLDLPRRPQADYHNAVIRAHAQPAVFGLEMYRKLQESRITLNTHIDLSREEASNMRLFEATGVGTCLLNEAQRNLRDVFEPDREVVTYRSADEIVEKVRYLLAHESERQSIAAAGQRRVLKDHTFSRRAEQLDALIARELKTTA